MIRNVCKIFFGGGGRNLKEINNLPDIHADGSVTQKWVSNKLVGRCGQTASGSR